MLGFLVVLPQSLPPIKPDKCLLDPGAPLRSALICTDARMAAAHNMLSLNVQWMITPRGVVYLGQCSIGSGQFNLHKCLLCRGCQEILISAFANLQLWIKGFCNCRMTSMAFIKIAVQCTYTPSRPFFRVVTAFHYFATFSRDLNTHGAGAKYRDKEQRGLRVCKYIVCS